MAEDVAQEAFIRILRHAAVYDVRRGSVATWTLTITRNLAIDALRVRRPIPTAPEDRAFLDLISSERLPDDAAAMSESVAQARSALAALPMDQRRAIVLAVMYGRTVAESRHSSPYRSVRRKVEFDWDWPSFAKPRP